MASEAINAQAREAAHQEPPPSVPPDEVVRDFVASTSAGTSRFRQVVVLLGLLFVAGIAAGVIKILTEGDDQTKWGYVAAMMAFIITVAGGAPMVAMAPVLAKANWVRPVTRISALISFGSIVSLLLMVPLLFVLPPLVTEGARRRTIWFEGPDYSPHIWGVVALLTLIVAGFGLFYSSAIPDFAAMRDHATGWRQSVGRAMARGWIGTDVQWRSLRMRIGMFGTFYFFVLVFVHFLISTDWAMSVVPGWRDAIFPMYHAISGIQAGIAVSVLGLWAVRRYLKLEKYIHLDQFWSLGRLLFAFTLLWVYFFFSGFIVFWYGRAGADVAFLDLMIRGPMVWAFAAGVVLIWFAPWWWLIWNRVRRSFNGTAIGAAMILVGVLLDRVRIYVTAWSVPPERIHDKFLEEVPPTVWPNTLDYLVIIGSIAGAIFLVMLMTRVIPPVSVWEVQQFNLLSKPVGFMRTKVSIIGKPD